MQNIGWLEQAIFYFSKRVAWRWRWTFASIFAGIGLYYYDDEAGIIIWSLLAAAVFLTVTGLLVFFKSSKLVAVDNNGVTFYDSSVENGVILINWNFIETISTQKDITDIKKDQPDRDPSEEPYSLFFQLTNDPFPNDFYPSHFSWDKDSLLLELSTRPTQGFSPLLKIIHQYHSRLLKLHGYVLDSQPSSSIFGAVFGFCYDVIMFMGITAISLIIAFYQVFETSDPLARIKEINETELLRLQGEVERRFLGEQMDFSVKSTPVLTYFPSRIAENKDKHEVLQLDENINQQLIFLRHFQTPPHNRQSWQAGLFSLNASLSWSDEVAYEGDYSLKIKMTKKKIDEPEPTSSAWYSSLRHETGQGYLLAAYVLTPDDAHSSLAIETFDAKGDLIRAFHSECKALEFKNEWLLTKYKIAAEKISPMTDSIRFAVQQCISKEDTQVGTLYYDAIRAYALKNQE
ncbi:MAG: hypothetical protein GQ569_05680 [Methylococcaceae bacterium]|nr:hypothetical protein [Methylococcaceae bacterium]